MSSSICVVLVVQVCIGMAALEIVRSVSSAVAVDLKSFRTKLILRIKFERGILALSTIKLFASHTSHRLELFHPTSAPSSFFVIYQNTIVFSIPLFNAFCKHLIEYSFTVRGKHVI